jgi:hypothetical protein
LLVVVVAPFLVEKCRICLLVQCPSLPSDLCFSYSKLASSQPVRLNCKQCVAGCVLLTSRHVAWVVWPHGPEGF